MQEFALCPYITYGGHRRHAMLSHLALHHIPLRQDLSLNSRLALLALLTGQPVLGSYVSPHPHESLHESPHFRSAPTLTKPGFHI